MRKRTNVLPHVLDWILFPPLPPPDEGRMALTPTRASGASLQLLMPERLSLRAGTF
jgi:hypothetical protein